jgi:dihydroorotase
MHEGVTSTFLGLPGKPAIAEELAIARDIELVKYTGSKIHFTGVSTARSLELIANAKKEGLSVSCSVTPYHLFFCDEDLNTYDTNLKVSPPLRTKADRAALQNGVLNGTVDCIASHHLPQNSDDKLVEFEYAKNGMLGLQTAYALVQTALPQLSDEQIGELLGGNARKIFNLATTILQEGEQADLTLFSKAAKWTFKQSHNLSRSANTPFYNFEFTGKPFGIIHKDKLFLNKD